MTEELLTSDNHNLSVIENNINHYFTKTIPIQKSYEEAKQFLEDLKLFTPYLLWWNNYNSVHILNESELKIIEPEIKASAEAEKLAQKTEEPRLAQKAEAEKLAQEAALVKKQLEAERLKREGKEKQKERLALFALKGMGGKRIRSRKMRKTNKKGTSKRRKTSRRRR